MWKITTALCADEAGRRWRSLDFDPQREGELRFRFRLLCADGEACYEGVTDIDDREPTTWPTEDGISEILFDFGMPHAGCNRIQVWRDGQWRET